MRLSLPPGTLLQGMKTSYVSGQLLHVGERSLTVQCQDGSGKLYRLKLFNGDSCITEALQRKLLSIPMKGVAAPVDMGEYGGRRFWVLPQMGMKNATEFPIALNVLTDRIIPQMAYVMNQYHRNRILLRDISPQHILYDPAIAQIRYCGFSNPAFLQDGATITKTPGFGQPSHYLAPEVEKYGYSTCSDYFTLGMTLLTLVKGYDPMKNMTSQQVYASFTKGVVPGIDMAHLKNTPYHLYSKEDKVMYLILGLLLPNPKDRWGYGEIRCFCNGQQIPLVRKEGRIAYQYNESFYACGTRCWNDRQLAYHLGPDKSLWNQEAFGRLHAFLLRQKPECGQILSEIAKDPVLDGAGKMFRCIYLLQPGMDKLYWKGKSYGDTAQLVKAASGDKNAYRAVEELLRQQCLSWFLQNRRKVVQVKEQEIQEVLQMEAFEREQPGKGVNRCMMRYAAGTDQRTFLIGSKQFGTMEEFTDWYRSKGAKLRACSQMILESTSFQAWLWASGLEAAAQSAAAIAKQDPQQSFYLLLKLCEMQTKNPQTQRKVRQLYLQWGEYAPLYWLSQNTKGYKVLTQGYQPLMDTFCNTPFDFNKPLEELSHTAEELVFEYQSFVNRTIKQPKKGDTSVKDSLFDLYTPVRKEYAFDKQWENGLEVCSKFMEAMAEGM